MIARLLRDPIARVVLFIWAGTAALYFIPGIPHDFLERLGDRFSTLPLWPWACAACLYGIGATRDRSQRRFWTLQATSFAALLVIELPWALARAGDTTFWNLAAEWCYFAYYSAQLASAAKTRAGVARGVGSAALAAGALSALAFTRADLYNGSWPSYLTYLSFDAAMAVTFWRGRSGASADWLWIFSALTATSCIVFATDVLDLLWYQSLLNINSGMKTDILWTVPPLCYALVARVGRQRLETPA